MKRALAVAGITTALSVGLVPAAMASQPETETFTVLTVQTSSQMTAHTVSFTENLFQGGRWVGHDRISCTQAANSFTNVVCTGRVWFSGVQTSADRDWGSLGVGPSAVPVNQTRFAVTVRRGTGDFAGDQGVVYVHNLNQSGTRSRLTFSLVS
jgi:hypothetical protein